MQPLSLFMVPGNLSVSGIFSANLPTGNANYIQNQNTAQKATSNFNISGTGSANILSASQYRIGDDRVLATASGNLAVGIGTGVITIGSNNSFLARVPD